MDMGVAQSDCSSTPTNGSSQIRRRQVDKEAGGFSCPRLSPFNVIAALLTSGIGKALTTLKGQTCQHSANPRFRSARHNGVVLDAKGWTLDDFALAIELKPKPNKLLFWAITRSTRFIYTVGHPNGSIPEAVSTRRRQAGAVKGEAIGQAGRPVPLLRLLTIPVALYKGTDADVKTFGVKATFGPLPTWMDEVVYELQKLVFDNLTLQKAAPRV